MNHASLGYLNDEGELVVEQELLNSLCMGLDSQLYGLYYPATPYEYNPQYKDITLKNDLMLTPIPPRFWPVSARIHVYLRNMPGSMALITKYFKVAGISIIHGEATRSAYRYGTWSLHIAFEELLKSPLHYNNETNYCEETFEALQELFKKIDTDDSLKNVLFAPDYFRTIDGTVNAPLAYFSNFYKNREDNTWLKDKSHVQPFTLTLKRRGNKQALVGDEQFKKVLKFLNTDKDFLPAIAFSELDTRSLNIRTALIPMGSSNRFFKVGIAYERGDKKDSAIGILDVIIANIKNYHIWQVYNYITESSSNKEIGHFVLIVEEKLFLQANKTRTEQFLVELAFNLFDELLKAGEEKMDNVKFATPVVIPLPKPPVLEKLFSKNDEITLFGTHKPDVFISYSHADKKWVKNFLEKFEKHGLRYTIDSEFLSPGDNIKNSVLAQIIACREICVILSDESAQSQWVARERGAAWVLGKKTTTIVLTPNIPASEGENLYIDGRNSKAINSYLRDIVNRKREEEAERFSNIFEK